MDSYRTMIVRVNIPPRRGFYWAEVGIGEEGPYGPVLPHHRTYLTYTAVSSMS